jgi:periplasmic mercuric ion binding protein
MKTINILFAIIIAFIAIPSARAQSGKETINVHTKSQTVKVYGECGMCKKRIEKAASAISGVESATWDVVSKMLTVKYDLLKPEAVDSAQRNIASVGHDTEKFRAEDAAYESLPECCHYQRKL